MISLLLILGGVVGLATLYAWLEGWPLGYLLGLCELPEDERPGFTAVIDPDDDATP